MTHAGRITWGMLRAVLVMCLIVSVAASAAPPGESATTRPGRSRGHHGRPRRQFNEQQIREILTFARKHYPDEAGRIERLLRGNRARAMARLRRLHRVYVSVQRYPEDVAQIVIDRRTASLAISRTARELARTADPARRAKLTDRLKGLLAEHFDLEQKIKEHEVRQLAQRVAELAEQVKARKGRRDQIISARLGRLLTPRRAAARPATSPRTTPTARSSRPHRRPSPGRRHKLTAEQVEEVMAFARQHIPELNEPLDRLRKQDTRRSRRLLAMAHGLIRRIQAMPPDVRRAAISMHKINLALLREAAKARKTQDPEARGRLVQSMRKRLAEQFAHEQVVKEYEVRRLRRELATLKANLQQRARDRASIIARRVARLTSPRRPAARTSPARS